MGDNAETEKLDSDRDRWVRACPRIIHAVQCERTRERSHLFNDLLREFIFLASLSLNMKQNYSLIHVLVA